MLREILVIDDNPDIRFLICNILKEKKFNVRSAANYDQAVLEINKKMPDLSITNLIVFIILLSVCSVMNLHSSVMLT